MKGIFSTSILIILLTISSIAQRSKKDDSNGDYYMLKGSVYEVDMITENEKKASDVQVVVYQDHELFVAFFTDAAGAYEFFLPLGHSYEVWFGGAAFVNKKVAVDATQFPKERKPRTVTLDMGLFRPIEGVEFPMLNTPFVNIRYDAEMDEISPDFEFTGRKTEELNKYFVKIKKDLDKKNKKKKKG